MPGVPKPDGGNASDGDGDGDGDEYDLAADQKPLSRVHLCDIGLPTSG